MISIIIPCRPGETADVTLESLKKQTYKDFIYTVVVDEDLKGANWARNQPLRNVTTEYVLFSDNDIEWLPDALQNLVDTIKDYDVSYVYGSYDLHMPDGSVRTEGHKDFSSKELRRQNFISTMSLVKTKDFPGWDESIKRFQDWDVWLTMLDQGKVGMYCGKKIFDTKYREGITFGSVPFEDSYDIIIKKHRL